jgi:hypothetical protein
MAMPVFLRFSFHGKSAIVQIRKKTPAGFVQF